MEDSPAPAPKQVLLSCGVLMLTATILVVLALTAALLYLNLAR